MNKPVTINCGSTDFQIITLTKRINHLNEHLTKHAKDHATRRGLMMLVGQRRRLSKYLQRKNPILYKQTIEIAGLRK
jgi:small subunit ribosomal protein S15